MAIFTSVIVGIVVAWLASLLMETDGREDFRRNVIAGIVGAFVGSWILGAFSEPVSAGKFSFGLLFASMCGSAFVLYAISRLTRA